jgi:DNA replication and repair protein RecF
MIKTNEHSDNLLELRNVSLRECRPFPLCFFRKKNMPADLCSTGEQKALLISIILAQTKCQILDRGFAPILLLDEVTTHLDNQKRDALLQKISDLSIQAWITSTEPQNFGILKNKAQFFAVRNNSIFSL